MNGNIQRSAILFFVSIVLVLSSASLNEVSAQCDNTTDAAIVAAINAKIAAEKSLAGQASHINVISVNLAVKLTGWTDTKRDYDRLMSIVGSTDCVRLVNPNFILDAPPPENSSLRSASGCTAGTKPCGDVCIPEAEACSITSKP